MFRLKISHKIHGCALIQQGILATACLLSLKRKNEIVIITITLKVANLMGHLDDPLSNCVDSLP